MPSNAFESGLAHQLEEVPAATDNVIAVAQRIRASLQELGQFGLAQFKAPGPQVSGTELQQVEGVVMRADAAAGEPCEIGPAMIIEQDQLTIKHEPLGRQGRQCRDDLLAAAEVVTVPGVKPRWAAVPNCEHAEAVVFDLEEPIVPVECDRSAPYNLKWKVTRAEHATVLGKSGPALQIEARIEGRRAANMNQSQREPLEIID